MDENTQNEICHNITGSNLINDKHRRNRKRPTMNQSYLKFKNKYPSPFDRLYEQSMTPTFSGDKVYARKIILYKYHLEIKSDLVIREYVFACMIADPNEENFFLHMVSGEYNLNDTSNPHIAGRFIINHTMQGVYSVTLAEEPAKSLSVPGVDAERSYLTMREVNELGEFVSFEGYKCKYIFVYEAML